MGLGFNNGLSLVETPIKTEMVSVKALPIYLLTDRTGKQLYEDAISVNSSCLALGYLLLDTLDGYPWGKEYGNIW